jgi:16S rRNA G1207 methylase RsmC
MSKRKSDSQREQKPKPFSHYFTGEDAPATEGSTFTYALDRFSFTFRTAGGVFSKERVDTGSEIMLKQFLKVEAPARKRVLDLGCGYGLVGIVIGRVFSGVELVFLDVNARAIKVARENAKENDVTGEFVSFDFTDDNNCQEMAENPFDFVLCNPPVRAGKAVMEKMLLNALLVLKPGGKLYVVVKTSLGGKSWQDWFEGLDVDLGIGRKSGYRVLVATKRG